MALMLSPRFLMRVVRSEIEKGARFIESARKLYEELMLRLSITLIFRTPEVSRLSLTFISRVWERPNEIAMLRPDPGTP